MMQCPFRIRAADGMGCYLCQAQHTVVDGVVTDAHVLPANSRTTGPWHPKAACNHASTANNGVTPMPEAKTTDTSPPTRTANRPSMFTPWKEPTESRQMAGYCLLGSLVLAVIAAAEAIGAAVAAGGLFADYDIPMDAITAFGGGIALALMAILLLLDSRLRELRVELGLPAESNPWDAKAQKPITVSLDTTPVERGRQPPTARLPQSPDAEGVKR